MAESYDNLQGTEQDAKDHPDTSPSPKGHWGIGPDEAQQSDNRRIGISALKTIMPVMNDVPYVNSRNTQSIADSIRKPK